MNYMKSRVELPIAFLRGARNILVASMLAVPLAGFAATENETIILDKADALVNITGKVIDQDGNPVVGATVLVKGTKSGVQTDENGVFRINLPERNTTIVVSYIGYDVHEVNVAGMTSITIELKPSDAIDEVIVTGYGTQKRSEIVGSVVTITGEELMDIPAPNIAGALRNQIPGVGVSEASGRPGSRITLNIRGASMSGAGQGIGATTEPLYIVDGITVSADVFDALDPSMVEDITFLKDASAAIYGAAGAKGVVLVTTKRGKQGKPSISYNGYLGVTDAARRPEFLSTYELAEFLNEGYYMANASQGSFFSEADLDYLRGLDVDSWYDQLWKPAVMQRHNLSISGGGENTTFFVGGSFQNQNANYAGMKHDKYTLRSGLTTTIVEGLKADIAFNVDHSIRESKNQIGNETDAGFYEGIVSTPDWYPMYIDGYPVDLGSRSNPLAALNSGYLESRKGQGYSINASLTWEPKFLKGLSARVQMSQRGGNENTNTYRPPYRLYQFERMGNNNAFFSTTMDPDQEPWGIDENNSLTNPTLAQNKGYQGFVTLSYNKTFADHTLGVIVGGEQTRGYSENLGVRWLTQLVPGFEDYWAFDQNTMQRTARAITEHTKRSGFGRASYDYKKKYMLQVVTRLDASSNFARGDRWGWSPSVGAGWNISEENFFKDNISFINNLKLRVNWGITGDDRVDDRLWQERYLLGINDGYLFGDQYGVGINPSTFPNLSITWEKRETFNFGLDATLLNNKMNVTLEIFKNRTYDGFDKGADQTNPLYAGLLAPVVNYREAHNWGSEISVGYKTKLAEDWSLSTNMNFGIPFYGGSIVTQMLYPPNDILEKDLDDGKWLGTKFGVDPRIYNSGNIGFRTQGIFRTQEQLDAFMSENPNYTINGEVPQVGWLVYEDVNGDGVVNHLDQTLLQNRRTNSTFGMGGNIGINYKSFSLRTNLVMNFGGRAAIDSRARTRPDLETNVPILWRDRWTPDDPMNGIYPRADDPYINRHADIWTVNGTIIRINNMTFSYSLPSNVARRLGLGSARILATGNNLWVLVNPFSYKDPYTSSAYNYPTVRTLSLGLSASL